MRDCLYLKGDWQVETGRKSITLTEEGTATEKTQKAPQTGFQSSASLTKKGTKSYKKEEGRADPGKKEQRYNIVLDFREQTTKGGDTSRTKGPKQGRERQLKKKPWRGHKKGR